MAGPAVPAVEDEWMWHSFSAFGFLAPFAVLLVLWAALIPHFEVNPRLFAHLESMAHAGPEGIKDRTLVHHVGVRRLHITIGMLLALVFTIPLDIHRHNGRCKQSTTEGTDKHI
jgi:taurine transport system permease protein